jgi:hypothetical protein
MGIVPYNQSMNSQLNFATLALMVFPLCSKSWGSGNGILVPVEAVEPGLVYTRLWNKGILMALFFKSMEVEASSPFGAKWSLQLLHLTSWNLASSPHLIATSHSNLIWTMTSCPRLTTKDNSLIHHTKFSRSESGSSHLKMDMRKKQKTSSPCRGAEVGEWRQSRMCVFHNWWVLFAT